MIKSIEISKLFGRFNYKIDMKPNGVTIITGPNGFGKSTILKIVDALSKGEISFFVDLDFSTLSIIFDSSQKITLKKTDKNIIFDGIELPLPTNVKDVPNRHNQRIPPLSYRPLNNWRIGEQKKTLTDFKFFLPPAFKEIRYFIDKYKLELPTEIVQKLEAKIAEIIELSGEVRLISEQRLLKLKRGIVEPQIVNVINELPKKLKLEISRVSEEYSSVANKLDSSYPKRLFNTKEGLKDNKEYVAKLKEANQKFTMLCKYNFVDMSLIDEKDYKKQYSTALKIYFDDFSKKYKVFEAFIEKLEMFTKIINARLAFKELRISRDKGFEVVDSELPDKILELDQLSSGEKQEIVLFYDLVFNTKAELLLLIDEPEISLHITWQKKFLNDLLEVSKNVKLQAIVATHSPQIINNHWDIQIDLGELYGKQFY
jgi:predicted ATP-binding protein involved in virulence